MFGIGKTAGVRDIKRKEEDVEKTVERINKWLWTPTRVFGLDRPTLILLFNLFLYLAWRIGLGVGFLYAGLAVTALMLVHEPLITLLWQIRWSRETKEDQQQ